MLKYDVIKTGEHTYRLVEKETQRPVNMMDVLVEQFHKGEIKK